MEHFPADRVDPFNDTDSEDAADNSLRSGDRHPDKGIDVHGYG